MRRGWIRGSIALAFGCYGAGFIAMLAGVLVPFPLVGIAFALILMVVVPLVVVFVLRKLPRSVIPPADTDTLINIAGLLVTAMGFNLIPIWKWIIEILETPGGWLVTPTPTPDLSVPNILFTALALALAVWALYRGLKDPNHKLAQLATQKRNLQRDKNDLIKVMKRMSTPEDLAELNRCLSKPKNPKDPEELHGILKDFMRDLQKRRDVLDRTPEASAK